MVRYFHSDIPWSTPQTCILLFVVHSLLDNDVHKEVSGRCTLPHLSQ